MIQDLKKDLQELANPEKAELLQRFFKTGKGHYGEGDVFLGITVPEQRKIAKKYTDLSLKEIQELILSEIHEYRLVSLLILIEKYKKSKDKKEIFEFYLKNTKKINNWDLVDLSAPNIVGDFLLDKDKNILYKLAKYENLWEKRISIVSTFAFIRNNQFDDTLKIAEILLNDAKKSKIFGATKSKAVPMHRQHKDFAGNHDLIHKAVGWMLREVGKRDEEKLEEFLKKYYKDMPRTMLRYAIERFDEEKRKKYLKGKV